MVALYEAGGGTGWNIVSCQEKGAGVSECKTRVTMMVETKIRGGTVGLPMAVATGTAVAAAVKTDTAEVPVVRGQFGHTSGVY